MSQITACAIQHHPYLGWILIYSKAIWKTSSVPEYQVIDIYIPIFDLHLTMLSEKTLLLSFVERSEEDWEFIRQSVEQSGQIIPDAAETKLEEWLQNIAPTMIRGVNKLQALLRLLRDKPPIPETSVGFFIKQSATPHFMSTISEGHYKIDLQKAEVVHSKKTTDIAEQEDLVKSIEEAEAAYSREMTEAASRFLATSDPFHLHSFEVQGAKSIAELVDKEAFKHLSQIIEPSSLEGAANAVQNGEVALQEGFTELAEFHSEALGDYTVRFFITDRGQTKLAELYCPKLQLSMVVPEVESRDTTLWIDRVVSYEDHKAHTESVGMPDVKAPLKLPSFLNTRSDRYRLLQGLVSPLSSADEDMLLAQMRFLHLDEHPNVSTRAFWTATGCDDWKMLERPPPRGKLTKWAAMKDSELGEYYIRFYLSEATEHRLDAPPIATLFLPKYKLFLVRSEGAKWAEASFVESFDQLTEMESHFPYGGRLDGKDYYGEVALLRQERESLEKTPLRSRLAGLSLYSLDSPTDKLKLFEYGPDETLLLPDSPESFWDQSFLNVATTTSTEQGKEITTMQKITDWQEALHPEYGLYYARYYVNGDNDINGIAQLYICDYELLIHREPNHSWAGIRRSLSFPRAQTLVLHSPLLNKYEALEFLSETHAEQIQGTSLDLFLENTELFVWDPSEESFCGEPKDFFFVSQNGGKIKPASADAFWAETIERPEPSDPNQIKRELPTSDQNDLDSLVSALRDIVATKDFDAPQNPEPMQPPVETPQEEAPSPRETIFRAARHGAGMAVAAKVNDSILDMTRIALGEYGSVLDHPLGRSAARAMLPAGTLYGVHRFEHLVPKAPHVRKACELAIEAASYEAAKDVLLQLQEVISMLAQIGLSSLRGDTPAEMHEALDSVLQIPEYSGELDFALDGKEIHCEAD